MNKHLFNQRVKSIDHYNEQIDQLNNTLTETKSVRNDLVKSMAEFCPFKVGHIIMHKTRNILRKITHDAVTHQNSSNFEIFYQLKCKKPDSYSDWGQDTIENIYLDEVENWKILNEIEIENQQQ